MDLKTRGVEPSAAERGAVDAVLGADDVASFPRSDGRAVVAGAPSSAPAGAARRQRPGGVDQPTGDRPHRRTPRRVARRDPRRRHLLRAVLDEREAVTSGARLRRRRLSLPGRRPRGRSSRRRPPVAVSRNVRAGPCRARHRCRRTGASHGARRCRGRPPTEPRGRTRPFPQPRRLSSPVPQAGDPDLVLLAGSAAPIRSTSTPSSPTAVCSALEHAANDRPGGGDRPGRRRRPARPGWCRVPDRDEVAGGAQPGRDAAPSGVQRRRVGAGHVQGSGADRERSVRPAGVDDDRCPRRRLRPRLDLPARRVPGGGGHAGVRRSSGSGPKASSAPTSTSRSGGEPAPTSAARRPRSSTRSRDSGASRATSRRTRSRWVSSVRRPSSTTSRP